MKLQQLIEDVKKNPNSITQITVLTNDYDFLELLDGEMKSQYSDLKVSETYKEENILIAFVNAEVVGIETL